MLKPSFFTKQNLTPKQKAVLSFWQETKGLYVEDHIKEITKNGTVKKGKLFEESEYQQLLNFHNNNELLEYYMWSQVLDALSLSNTSAQGYYSDIVSYIQVITFGLPCEIGQVWQWPQFIDHKHEYYSWHLREKLTYSQAHMLFKYYVDEFFLSAVQAIMLNIYMDEAISPLTSEKLLERVISIDKIIDKFINDLEGPVQTAFSLIGVGFIEKQLSENMEMYISEAEENIKRLLQPLMVFNYTVQNEKVESCRRRTLEIFNQAKKNSCA